MRFQIESSDKVLRRGTAFAIAAVLGMMILAIQPAVATPIHPTPQELLQQAERPQAPFVPAQAGWKDSSVEAQAAGLEGFSFITVLHEAQAARARRELLLAIARPDLRVLLAFGAIILLLRRMRTVRENTSVPAPHPAKA